jgi:hypothetical protein
MLIVSLFVAKVSFDYIKDAYLSYLPNIQTLDKYINAFQSEFSTFRRQYTDALEKSLIFSIVIFLISFSLMEYVYKAILKQYQINRSKVFKEFDNWKDKQDIKNDTTQENIIKDKLFF